MKISEVIAKMKKVNETSAYVVWRCPLCRLVDFANTEKLEQHLKNEHGNDFEPEEKAINYQEFFNLDGKLIINAKNNEVYAKQSDFGWSCTFCSVLSDSARHALAHAYQHYKVAVSHFHKPESDGQAEQHLGAVTATCWDEVTEWTPEVARKWRDYIAKNPNKVKCAKWALGEWGKDQPTNKYDNGKPRLDLVPPAIIEAVGEIRTYGVGKYGDSESWHTVEPARYRAAMMRHLCAYLRDPASKDEESGLSHLAHLATNIAFLLELEREEK